MKIALSSLPSKKCGFHVEISIAPFPPDLTVPVTTPDNWEEQIQLPRHCQDTEVARSDIRVPCHIYVVRIYMTYSLPLLHGLRPLRPLTRQWLELMLRARTSFMQDI